MPTTVPSGLIPDEMRALLALQLAPGLGAARTAALLEHFGSAASVIAATPAQLAEVTGIGDKLAVSLVEALRKVDVNAEMGLMEKHGVRPCFRGHDGYPSALAEIYDPPPVLYVRGRIVEVDAKAIAIVGSRHSTSYGRRMTARIATDLVRAGYTIVSGLARGIDGAAHRAALDAGGRTLAVLAGGLTEIYPPEHKAMAEDVANAGALLSEACMAQEPLPNMFPARNRIISALAKAVVIVEAAEKSGALITADHAAEQGKTVLAVPGPADSQASGGTNSLIRQGAILCRHGADVLEEVEGVSARAMAEKGAVAASVPAGPPPGLDDNQLRVWDSLAGGPRHQDEMVEHLGLAVSQLAGMLLGMEMKKIVRRLPGNRYERR